MGGKVGKVRHQASDILPVYQGNQYHHVGKSKVKTRTAVSETNNKLQEDYGSRQSQSIMHMG